MFTRKVSANGSADLVESQTVAEFVPGEHKQEDEYEVSTGKYALEGMTHAEERATTREIERRMIEEHDRQELTRKILFLGAGESGKTTIIKQMRQIHGIGFNHDDFRAKKQPLHANLITAIQVLAQQSLNLAPHLSSPPNEETETLIRIVLEWDRRMQFLPEHARTVTALWNTPTVQETFTPQFRQHYQIGDNVKYLMERALVMADVHYIPNFSDLLFLREQTRSVRTEMFEVKNEKVMLFDVGGQRGQRKKWINYFDDVHVVVFVASLAGFNQKVREDGKTIRIQEARRLLHDTLNLDEFRDTSCVLLLNKLDLFQEFLQTIPITNGIPEFPAMFDENGPHAKDYRLYQDLRRDRELLAKHQHCDPHNAEAVLDYLHDWFLYVLRPRRSSRIYLHHTVGVDTTIMEKVVADILDTILDGALKANGLQ